MKIVKREIYGFLFAGCCANLISFLTYSIFFKILNISIIYSASIGQIFGLITNYFFNSRISFRKNLLIPKKLIFIFYYFLAIFCVGKFIEFLTLMNIDYKLSWLIAILIATFSNFIFLKFVAFKS